MLLSGQRKPLHSFKAVTVNLYILSLLFAAHLQIIHVPEHSQQALETQLASIRDLMEGAAFNRAVKNDDHHRLASSIESDLLPLVHDQRASLLKLSISHCPYHTPLMGGSLIRSPPSGSI